MNHSLMNFLLLTESLTNRKRVRLINQTEKSFPICVFMVYKEYYRWIFINLGLDNRFNLQEDRGNLLFKTLLTSGGSPVLLMP